MRSWVALAAGTLATGAVLIALGGPATSDRAPARAHAGAADAGRGVFARMGCGGCHRLAAGGGSGIPVGPDLDSVLPSYDAGSLRSKIVDPYPAGEPAQFSAMPEDFESRMSESELDALVAFLLAAVRR